MASRLRDSWAGRHQQGGGDILAGQDGHVKRQQLLPKADGRPIATPDPTPTFSRFCKAVSGLAGGVEFE
ncbi:MAG TPA: hypothetical protein PKM43_24150 [Verrucomicrobiota bacterium]|nr:hypothetical protein [Verrucomicrobiota bacterium]